MNIYYSNHFKECYNALPVPIQKKANKAFFILMDDFWNPTLHTKKLKGLAFQGKELWSINVDPHYRVRFFIENNGENYYLVDTGPLDPTQSH